MIRHLLTCLVLSTWLMLAGCGDGTPRADFTFIIGNGHNTLDPQKMSWAHDIRIARCLYEPLVELDFETLEIQPAAAERWKVSDDGLTYTFHIREDARWSNGDPLTAGDYIYAWRRVMLPDSAADYTKFTWHIRGAKALYDYRTQQLAEYARIREQGDGGDSQAAEATYQLALDYFTDHVGLRAADDRTLVVELEKPTPYFLKLVAFTTLAPVHRESVEKATGFSRSTGMANVDPGYWSDPQRLVTNGPYTIADRAFRQHLLLKQSPHYWDRQRMKNTSILELIVEDVQTGLLKYRNGEADAYLEMPSTGAVVANLVRQEPAFLHKQISAGTYFYNFNCMPTLPDGRANPFHDPRVRRAFAMAIDRDRIVQQVTRLNQPVALSYVPEGVLADYQPPVDQGVSFSPEQARALLAEAGYPGGKGLEGFSILYNTGYGHEDIAQAVSRMWQEHLGVQMAPPEGVEGTNFSHRLKSQQFVISRASWFGDYPDPTTWLDKMVSNDGNNDCRWSDATYDRLLEQAADERNPAARLDLLRQAEARLLHEQPMAMIYQYQQVFLWDPQKVTGLVANPWNRWELDQVAVAE